MKPIMWDPEKNSRLQNERDGSFEDVVLHTFAGGILIHSSIRTRRVIQASKSM
jgi:hypothetical protein